jgi:hypothetical protein
MFMQVVMNPSAFGSRRMYWAHVGAACLGFFAVLLYYGVLFS